MKWKFQTCTKKPVYDLQVDEILEIILHNRGLKQKKDVKNFLNPKDPTLLTPQDVEIDASELKAAISRIKKAITKHESIVVHADYDADGVSAGAVMWEALHFLGANVMPYIPRRHKDGRGLNKESIDTVVKQFDPDLLITVDHGIGSIKGVSYASSIGIDTIISDHHVKGSRLPKCTTVHTTELSGSGIAWFIASKLYASLNDNKYKNKMYDLLSLSAIGTIADMVPLIGANRSIAKFGLRELKKTKRIGLLQLFETASADSKTLSTYSISHQIAPRINAMGRLEHALDALRLLCTPNKERAKMLADMLAITNKKRQDMTTDAFNNAFTRVKVDAGGNAKENLIFVGDSTYNQGIVGLIAGRLADRYNRPSIVASLEDDISKASARSIKGLDIMSVLNKNKSLLLDVGGHPQAAGFTFETKNFNKLKETLTLQVSEKLKDFDYEQVMSVDLEIHLSTVSNQLWKRLESFKPYGIKNPEPVFATRGLKITSVRAVGIERKHLKLIVEQDSDNKANKQASFDAIAFGFGDLVQDLTFDSVIDIAYTIDLNEWNGNKKLQLKIKDIVIVK